MRVLDCDPLYRVRNHVPILPADVIANIIPGAGYTDDLGVIAAALAIVLAYITPEVKQKARRTLERWFAPPAEMPAQRQ